MSSKIGSFEREIWLKGDGNPMKKLIVILGSNGVGKSTAAKAFLERNERCAYVDADWCRTINPFLLTPATRKAVTENIYCLFKNYLLCEDIDMVVFPYAFHGERKEIFDAVISRLKEDEIDFKVFTIVLRCSLEENRRRCELDGRDMERTERGIKNTFLFYDSFDCPIITTTDLSPEEVAGRIAEMIK